MTGTEQRRRWRSRQPVPQPDAEERTRSRFIVLMGMVVLAFVVLSGQLFRLQVLDVGFYHTAAEENRLRRELETPERGLIFDRNGKPLAMNAPSYLLSIIPEALPKGRDIEIYARLQVLTKVPAFEMQQKVEAARRRGDPFTPVVIARNVDYDTYLVVAERRDELPGVSADRELIRTYPQGAILGAVLGYVGPIDAAELDKLGPDYRPSDRTGKTGLETVYERTLRGAPGDLLTEVDASGRRLKTVDRQPSVPGNNLILGIDAEFQEAVARILQESLAPLPSKKGVALVMDVRTGEMLAYVSLPGYDNNIFSRPLDDATLAELVNNPAKPLLDHAIGERFAPGSTFKLVTGLAALESGLAGADSTIVSNRALLVKREDDPNRYDVFPEWNSVGFGPLNFSRAIANSSNVYVMCLAGGNCPDLRDGLGNDRLSQYAKSFGFGTLTGIDLPGEITEAVPSATWLRNLYRDERHWNLADTFYMGIGQGYMTATPLQVLRFTSAIANGGTLLRPRLVREIRDSRGRVLNAPRDESRSLGADAANLALLRSAMALAVREGTARPAGLPNVTVAGKTGTAEFGEAVGQGSANGQYREHGWFAGFAPYENPEIAVVVFHERGGGALTASPVAGRIFRTYFELQEQRRTGQGAQR